MSKPNRGNQPIAPITMDEMREAILHSGYPLELRVDSILKSSNYITVPNYVYPDPYTGKSREFDVLGFQNDPYEAKFNIQRMVAVECLNNSQPLTFFTKDRRWSANDLIFVKFFGLPIGLSKN